MMKGDVIMEIKTMKSLHEAVGIVIPTEDHGNVKIIKFNEISDWGHTVILYLERAHRDSAIGRFENSGWLPGGSMIVEKTDEPVTVFE